MTSTTSPVKILLTTSLLLCFFTSATPQTGGPFAIKRNIPLPGGVLQAQGLTLESVLGQPLVGITSNGPISVSGGIIVPQLVPTAAQVSVSGRVLGPGGTFAVRNAVVSIVDLDGIERIAVTGTFGFFKFTGISAGRSYVLSVQSRRYQYASTIIDVSDTVTGIVMIGEPRVF